MTSRKPFLPSAARSQGVPACTRSRLYPPANAGDVPGCPSPIPGSVPGSPSSGGAPGSQLGEVQRLCQRLEHPIAIIPGIQYSPVCVGKDELFRGWIGALEFPCPQFFGKPFRQMDLRETSGSLAIRPEFAPVDGLGDGQRIAVIKRAPAKSEQLAWAKRFRHVQRQQKPVSCGRSPEWTTSAPRSEPACPWAEDFWGSSASGLGPLPDPCSMASSKMDFM